MADKQEIIKVLTGEEQYIITSVLIDELGYSIHQILPITKDTLDTDTVIIAYSTSFNYYDNIVHADTHFITLAELINADTVLFSIDKVIHKVT